MYTVFFLIAYYYCMVLMHIVAHMPIHRHVILTNVTRTVPVSMCTSWLDVMLKHDHARHKVQEYANSGR